MDGIGENDAKHRSSSPLAVVGLRHSRLQMDFTLSNQQLSGGGRGGAIAVSLRIYPHKNQENKAPMTRARALY